MKGGNPQVKVKGTYNRVNSNNNNLYNSNNNNLDHVLRDAIPVYPGRLGNLELNLDAAAPKAKTEVAGKEAETQGEEVAEIIAGKAAGKESGEEVGKEMEKENVEKAAAKKEENSDTAEVSANDNPAPLLARSAESAPAAIPAENVPSPVANSSAEVEMIDELTPSTKMIKSGKMVLAPEMEAAYAGNAASAGFRRIPEVDYSSGGRGGTGGVGGGFCLGGKATRHSWNGL